MRLIYKLSMSVLAAIATSCFLQEINAADEELIKGTGYSVKGSKYYKRAYQEINDYLVKTVPGNSNVALNLEAARKWLESGDCNNRGCLPFFKQPIAAALEQFLSLSNVKNKCDLSEYVALYKNNKATSAHADKFQSNKGPFRRIDNLVYQISIAHAKDCQTIYEQAFETRFPVIMEQQADIIQKVDEFAGNIVRKRYDNHAGKYVVSPIESKLRCWIIYTQFVRKEFILSTEELKLADFGAREACKQFVRQLSDIFEPAKLDAKWNLELRDGRNETNQRFYSTWAKYIVCDSLNR